MTWPNSWPIPTLTLCSQTSASGPPAQDPVVHFYETFLAAYDPKLRESRGVYYTPEPVVSYLVRSVDYLLKTRFGCANGLADTATVEYEREEGRPAESGRKSKPLPRVF